MVSEAILKRLKKLKEQIREHDYRYYVLDEPSIPDADYDVLFQELKDFEEQYPELIASDSPTQRVGGTPAKSFSSVKHLSPMLSLDNAFSFEELERFEQRIKLLLAKGDKNSHGLGLLSTALAETLGAMAAEMEDSRDGSVLLIKLARKSSWGLADDEIVLVDASCAVALSKADILLILLVV